MLCDELHLLTVKMQKRENWEQSSGKKEGVRAA